MPLLDAQTTPIVRRTIGRCDFPTPFVSGLEYSAPARGPWTIMHLGLLVPDTHIVFVCAECCLRGVVMSAAEVNALDRFSTITIEDKNLLEGDTEDVLIEGVADVIAKLRYRPRAVLIYTSCVHEFIGSDLTFSFDALRTRFPDIDFTDCYMTPVLRKRISPDARNRRQIYSLLRRRSDRDNGVTIFADVRPHEADSDIRRVVEAAGRPWRTITATRRYDEYQELARSEIALAVNPVGKAALEWAGERLGMQTLMLSCGWSIEENTRMLTQLGERLGAPAIDWSEAQTQALEALQRARERIGNAPIAIDYTATTRPCSLARLLLEHGFNVSHLFVDQFLPPDRADFDWLQNHAPELPVFPTVHNSMVHARRELTDPDVVAIGQKAAYFTATDRFVNMIEGDGTDGLRSIVRLAERLVDAFEHPKSVRDTIQIKALGCTRGGCL